MFLDEQQYARQLVVIGSSAGGIEALSRLVADLPSDFPAAVVIAQHLDPQRPSSLVSILERHSTLPVRSVTNHAILEPGVILVVPSNEQVRVGDHEISLTGDGAERPSPSIDRLFQSAAMSYGEQLIGVILTGSGSDGSAGARMVKSHGGTVIIEDPATAEYPSMPQSLSPTTVDFSLELSKIGQTLHRLLTEDVPMASQEVEPGGELDRFLEVLRRQSNIDFSRYRTPTILRRLQRRMVATDCRSLDEYRTYLSNDQSEYQTLVSSFLIKVTEFFRDETLFVQLRDYVLPELIAYAKNNDYQLRFWSAGCATGEEAYSLAILLNELLGDQIHQFNIRIFATDLDAHAIDYARRGIYPEAALARMSGDMVGRYFTEYDGDYEVKKEVRSLVIFGQHDLGRRSPFPRIDLVLCRNVLIYFTEKLQERALRIFAFSVRHDGFLALGKSESVGTANRSFKPEHNNSKIYRRHGEAVMMPMEHGEPLESNISYLSQTSSVWMRSAGAGVDRARQQQLAAQKSVEQAESLLFELPIGLVVIDEQYDIVTINNQARRLLGIHGVAVGEDLIHLTRGLPLSELRSLITSALRADGPVVADLEVTQEAVSDGRTLIHASASAHSPASDEEGRKTVAIILSDVTPLANERAEAESALTRVREENQRLTRRAEQLERINEELYQSNSELAGANEKLRSNNQHLLLAHEESQVSSEEIETLNEELQATNEELETLNEELQATVEELNATNDDMQARTSELQEMTVSLEQQRQTSEAERARLEAVLGSMGEAVLVVHGSGEITPMNPERCAMILGEDPMTIVPEDEQGNSIPPDQTPIARAMNLETFAMQFSASYPESGRAWFEANARPIRGQHEDQGSVLVIRDVTDSSLRRLQEEFMSIASHELRTPLTALRGYLQMLQRQLPDDERIRRRISISLAMVNRLVRLVNDMLDVSRLQSGRFSLELDEYDMHEAVRESADLAESMSEKHRIELSLPDEPIPARLDVMRIQQVILNLLSNAITYSPDADVVNLRAWCEDDQLVVEVQDYGVGIPKDVQSEIYGRFFQVERGSHAASRGLGLGLYISRSIVEAHHGVLEVDSAPGEGSTFRVRVPLVPLVESTNGNFT